MGHQYIVRSEGLRKGKGVVVTDSAVEALQVVVAYLTNPTDGTTLEIEIAPESTG